MLQSPLIGFYRTFALYRERKSVKRYTLPI